MTVAARPPRASRLDAATSRLFRLDLSRTDVVKWVGFTRQLLAFLLCSVVTIAGLSAYSSTRLARGLLVDSLDGEAGAIARAAAQAAFVPLSLEDDASLGALAASYRGVEHLESLRIRDARGRVRAELPPRGRGRAPRRTRAPVLPVVEEGRGRPSAPAPVGEVEVDMRTDWIDAKTREIALTNSAIGGGIAALVVLACVVVIGALVDRTRELVGEARLVAEVKRANAELEAFSYSVAHDLRAPLRAIDGFSLALLEGYSDRLDERGRDYLRRLRTGSQRMAQQISELLQLSRVTRGELRREGVDLSGLAAEIAARLKSTAPERAVEFVVAPGVVAVGDPGLLRAALENLLGNSWKYTSRKPRARIEFGTLTRGARRTYFVRDDGAGFDMDHAEKLFKPFSRLHSPGEFEGTGIGLATVQRIVERHGGRIW
ncbi:MAG: hypothetical protein HY079_10925, partial [Elusimicrobia bacterium]|nr:hypothetical protein [Elusimicrobiota bacterium]